MTILLEARARKECAYWVWKEETTRRQRAAEACGGTILLGARAREERAYRVWKVEAAFYQRATEACKTACCDTLATRCDDLNEDDDSCDDRSDEECAICGDVGGQS